jgi:hypothetical protein
MERSGWSSPRAPVLRPHSPLESCVPHGMVPRDPDRGMRQETGGVEPVDQQGVSSIRHKDRMYTKLIYH